MALLELINVRKVYAMGEHNSFVALESIDLKIEEGEFVAFVGPSGSGKSTLLQILGLLDSPTEGTYKIFGMDTRKLNDDLLTKIRSKHLGFIFQMFNLLPRISAQDNVILPMIYTGEQYHPKQATDLLTQLGMEQHFFHSPAQLSGGQQQRVAIARALINKPKIIFADEPTGNLSQIQAQAILDELEKLHSTGITIVLVTHSEEFAQRAHRIIRIIDGKIARDHSRKPLQTKKSTSPIDIKRYQTKKFNWLLWISTLRLAMQSLSNKLIRTFLTMLGIIIGVFSVISLLSISMGAQRSVEQELRKIGSNMFRVSSEWPKIKGVASHQRSITKLNERDLKFLTTTQNPNIKDIAATSEGVAVLSFLGYSYSTKILGVSPGFEKMRDTIPSHGRFFSKAENDRQEKVCVLGQTVFQQLFKESMNPVGQTVKIDDNNYRVIGILTSKGISWGEDVDDVVYIPVETARKRLFGRNFYNYFYIQAHSENSLDKAMADVSLILRRNHNLPQNVENDFGIKNYAEMRETIEQVSKNFLILIVLIASISIIVGGIGIMNIMLVSVTERTREIGIRKAIGARRRDILSQFLVESVFISFMGATIGVILAYIFCIGLRMILNWDVAFDPFAVFLSFVFSVFVGIFFGLYPAKKAAQLNPINALRYE